MKGIIVIFVLIIIFVQIDANLLLDDINRELKQEGNNITALSRTRRYLVFPEGSSFQVVFDLTYPAVAIEGNAFMFGHTAAMAWELPSTPIFLDKKKIGNEEEKEKETETMTVKAENLNDGFEHSYDDHDVMWQPPLAWDYSEASPKYHSGWQRVISTSPFDGYHQQQFLENAVDSSLNNHRTNYNTHPNLFWNPNNIRRFVETSTPQKSPSFGNKPIHRTVAHHIQRRSKRELYSKVEKLLTALSKDGKSCVLKAICQANKLSSKKGSLWEEIVKAIFKAKHDMYPDEDHYDRAANLSHNCDRMYPNCDGHVLSNLFKNQIKK